LSIRKTDAFHRLHEPSRSDFRAVLQLRRGGLQMLRLRVDLLAKNRRSDPFGSALLQERHARNVLDWKHRAHWPVDGRNQRRRRYRWNRSPADSAEVGASGMLDP
jgi:hypothetical protein